MMASPLAGRVRSRLRRIGADPHLWLVIAFSVFAILPLAGPDYFFDAHDAPHSIFFLTEFDAALRDGVWYPGWATDQALGYGYPSFVFYSPLAYYVAEGFHLLGASKVEAVKWTWALATLGAGLAMYAYARHVLGRQRGVLAAVVYVYVPYHLSDIYVRADLREYCTFVWMPLALLAFHRLLEGVTARRVAAAGLAYGALWMTHNVVGLVFTPVLACYVVFRLLVEPVPEAGSGFRGETTDVHRLSWRERAARAAAALSAGLLGLGIAAALILPILWERKYILQSQWVHAGYDYAQHFVYPFQFLSGLWGYGVAGPGPMDGMSFQLGAFPVVLAVAAAVGAFRRPARDRLLISFMLSVTIALVLFMLPLAKPAWDLLPVSGLIQFPWRLLAVTAVTLAVLSGMVMPPVEESRLDARMLILAVIAVVASYAYASPQYTPVPDTAEGPLLTIDFELKYPDMVGRTAWTQETPSNSPLLAQYQAETPLVTAEALSPEASIEMIRAGGASDELWVRSPRGTSVRFYTYYYPGWRVYVDGVRLPDSALRPETVYGLLTVDISAGQHRVLLRWGDTPVRLVGKLLTVACLGLSLVLIMLDRFHRRADD